MSEQRVEKDAPRVVYGRRSQRSRRWLWWHERHGQITSWGVALDERPYWTCECGSKHYPERSAP